MLAQAIRIVNETENEKSRKKKLDRHSNIDTMNERTNKKNNNSHREIEYTYTRSEQRLILVSYTCVTKNIRTTEKKHNAENLFHKQAQHLNEYNVFKL